jgi:hypothetical protein
MMQVLCYGDSNTWGSDPADDERRFEWPLRWPGVLQRELGDAFHVVEEGLGGRTTVIDDPLLPHRSGLELLAPVLDTHAPLDLVIVMLGTNDISYAWASAADAADGAAAIAHLVLRSEMGPGGAAPAVLLVCPPPVGPFTEDAGLWSGVEEKSRALGGEFARVAAALRCPWLDAGEVVATSALDGWHLELSQHELLGVAVAAKARGLLG